MNVVEDDLAQPLVVGPPRAEVGVGEDIGEQHLAALRHGPACGKMPVCVALGPGKAGCHRDDEQDFSPDEPAGVEPTDD